MNNLLVQMRKYAVSIVCVPMAVLFVNTLCSGLKSILE